MAADYMVQADLEARVGADRVAQLFDDDVSGALESGESATLVQVLEEAEGIAASYLMRAYPTTDQITLLANSDPAFKMNVAWVALELASERRTEFSADDGKGAYWAQQERAFTYFENLSKGRRRSRGEADAGTHAHRGGKLQPTESAGESTSFVFAPSEDAPDGHGGYVLPLLFTLAQAAHYVSTVV